MARAAAARAVAPQFGKIQHKALPKEDPKLSAKNGNGTGKRTSPPTRNGKSADANGGKKSRQTSPEPNKKVKKPAPTTGYKGTARPALSEPEKKVKKAPAPTLGYTGTARPSEVAKRPPPSSSYRSTRERDRGPSYSRYSYVSEDEEEEEDYYESDVSDMEAGLDEVDEEEERALREARKEDKKAQMEEERLRQEKRARLQGLAKKRR